MWEKIKKLWSQLIGKKEESKIKPKREFPKAVGTKKREYDKALTPREIAKKYNEESK